MELTADVGTSAEKTWITYQEPSASLVALILSYLRMAVMAN